MNVHFRLGILCSTLTLPSAIRILENIYTGNIWDWWMILIITETPVPKSSCTLQITLFQPFSWFSLRKLWRSHLLIIPFSIPSSNISIDNVSPRVFCWLFKILPANLLILSLPAGKIYIYTRFYPRHPLELWPHVTFMSIIRSCYSFTRVFSLTSHSFTRDKLITVILHRYFCKSHIKIPVAGQTAQHTHSPQQSNSTATFSHFFILISLQLSIYMF